MERIPSDRSTSSERAKIAARGVDSYMDELIVGGWQTRTDLLVDEEGLIGGPCVKRVSALIVGHG
jgi:hypothetical protein